MSVDTQSGMVADGRYDAFRQNGAPSYYAEQTTPWLADILESGLIVAVCILAVSFYCILPGIPGRDRLFTFLWVTTSLFVVGVIVVTNFSYEWESATIHTSTKYKAGTGAEVHAELGLHVGLRGINITLKGEPVHQLNETINYNEHFGWSWRVGRIGFGPYASEFNQQYRAAQFRGLPLPILWVAEYFTLDGEGLRWGRLYLQAGLFAHMCLWLALALWLLSNILFFVLLRYGAYFLVLTGVSMNVACVIKHCIRNTLELEIPFAEDLIKLHYGVSFWLCLVTGCLCIVCGVAILLMDLRYPAVIARFFSADTLQDDDINEEKVAIASSDSTIVDMTGTGGTVIRVVTIGGWGSSERQSSRGDNFEHQSSKGDYPHKQDEEESSDSTYVDTTDIDTDIEPTDEEDEVEERPVSNSVSRGLIGKFQRPRRQSIFPTAAKTPERFDTSRNVTVEDVANGYTGKSQRPRRQSIFSTAARTPERSDTSYDIADSDVSNSYTGRKSQRPRRQSVAPISSKPPNRSDVSSSGVNSGVSHGAIKQFQRARRQSIFPTGSKTPESPGNSNSVSGYASNGETGRFQKRTQRQVNFLAGSRIANRRWNPRAGPAHGMWQ